MNLKQFLMIIFVALPIISFIGCVEPTDPTIEELARISSPDSTVDAVLLRKNFHATVPFIYEAYIVKANNKAGDEKDLILKSDHMNNIQLKWKEPRFLEISYSSGRIWHFQNFWQSKEVENFNYLVETRLKPMSDSFSLGQ